MKNTPLVLSVIALVAVIALGVIQLLGNGEKKTTVPTASGSEAVLESGAIVYFNLDRVIQEYDMANELRSAMETKVQGIQQEVNRRGNKLQSDVNDFQNKVNKGLMTQSTAQVQGENLQRRQNEFNNYASQKQQEIAEEQQVVLNQIGDAIKQFLDKFNADKRYGMIISTTGDILPSPVAAADPSLDITDEILAGLNDEYVKNKAKGVSTSSTSASDDKSDNTQGE